MLLKFVLCGAIAMTASVVAQEARTADIKSDKGKPPVTPAMELEATNFAKENHPELIELLHQLKATNSTQYEQAVRELSRVASTLSNTKKNDPKKYAVDLKAWQINSQIQVLAARLAMSATPELKDELRAKLLDQIDVKLEQQRLDRERTETRLKKLDETIAKTQETREQEASKAFDKITRTLKSNPKKDSKATSSEKGKEPAQDKPAKTPK
jgi:hypothetical protein